MTAADKIAEARALIEPLTGHTPGPWEAFGGVGIGVTPVDPSEGDVASCCGFSSGRDEREELDNAALIAAAPALRDTVAALTDLADAQAQENAKLRQRIEQLEGAVMTALVGRAVSKTKPCATPSPESAQ